MAATLSRLRAGMALPLADLAVLPFAEFRAAVVAGVGAGRRLAALFGRPGANDAVRLYAVLADDRNGTLQAGCADVAGAYPALTADCAQAHWFEREIAEQWGVTPTGHPWLKPIRFQPPMRPGNDVWQRPPRAAIEPGVTDFFRVEGEEVHEVAVGPVHAGVIEPGHFRFQCFGETVLHLEISLGYQHRGVERALNADGEAAAERRVLHYFETLAGDTTVGHAMAHIQAVEALEGVRTPARAQAIRAVALELERLANHTGDLGALAGDVGFLPTQSFCGRLRGDFLNMSALLCGNRFGRGLVRRGGVGFDLDPARRDDLLARLMQAEAHVRNAAELLFDTPSVLARFEDTGGVGAGDCVALGLVGPAARACGFERDVRQDHPSGIYRFQQVAVSSWGTGDVFARAFVRWMEIQRSVAFVKELLENLPEGEILAQGGTPAPESLAVSLVEGWRGEICHVMMTDAQGKRAGYKVVDPSFHNWMGLAVALRQQQISDFPLCNKSFNLSYCGHDL
jgi:Ni,Fe-hydrogenase III large subunit